MIAFVVLLSAVKNITLSLDEAAFLGIYEMISRQVSWFWLSSLQRLRFIEIKCIAEQANVLYIEFYYRIKEEQT